MVNRHILVFKLNDILHCSVAVEDVDSTHLQSSTIKLIV